MNFNGNAYNSVTFSIDMLDFPMLFFSTLLRVCVWCYYSLV